MDKRTDKQRIIFHRTPKDDGAVLYRVEEKDNITAIVYHEDDLYWTDKCRGKESISVTDTGNEIIIDFKDSDKRVSVNYSEIEELRILLDFMNTKGTNGSRSSEIYFKEDN